MAGLFCLFISIANGQEMTFDTYNGPVVSEADENLENDSKSNNTNLSDIEYTDVDLIEKDIKKSTKKPVYKNIDTKTEGQKTNKETASEKTKTTSSSESVLSFNFLYYMIQKFKFTEITDQ